MQESPNAYKGFKVYVCLHGLLGARFVDRSVYGSILKAKIHYMLFMYEPYSRFAATLLT